MARPAGRTATEASLGGAVVVHGSSAPGAANLSLLGGFRLEVGGDVVPLQPGGQRLLALLATHGPLSRETAARVLWPDAAEPLARMRTALWRMRASGMVRTAEQRLVLADDVAVDIRRWADAARRSTESRRADPADFAVLVTGPGELLPGWYEEWVLVERERYRKLRLRALLVVARNAYESGCYAVAVTAALATVQLEPLCEEAHCTLIQAHLAERNLVEAVRHYHRVKALLSSELGIQPARQLTDLLAAQGLVE